MIEWLRNHVSQLLRTAPAAEKLRGVVEVEGVPIAELDGDGLRIPAELLIVDEENPGDMMEPIGLRRHEPIELTGTWDDGAALTDEELDARLLADPDCVLCDECDRPATALARDIRETPPVDGWRNFEPMDTIRRGCSDHPPESKTIELDPNDPASWGIG